MERKLPNPIKCGDQWPNEKLKVNIMDAPFVMYVMRTHSITIMRTSQNLFLLKRKT